MRGLFHHHQSELVGDVAVPVTVRLAVLFCALRNPDTRPRFNWRRSSSTSSAKYVLEDLDATFSSLEWVICRLVKHGNDLGTCLPGPRGQTTYGPRLGSIQEYRKYIHLCRAEVWYSVRCWAAKCACPTSAYSCRRWKCIY